MDILKQMNRLFKIEACKSQSTEKDISDLLQFSSIVIPNEYIEIIREKTEIEILVDGKKYVRLWGAAGCIEMNSAYYIQKYIPNSLAIGDDECCNVLLYANGEKGFGVYSVALNDLETDGMIYISNSLKGFFVDGVGVEIFNNIV